jgi:tetratricopeptide (TPR) repeat protein
MYINKKIRLPIVFSILIGLCGCQTEQVTSENLPIMGDLVLGDYAVGYKTIFTYDRTRNGVPYSDWDGNLTNNHKPELGRQFQINVWYPAENGSGDRINYSHYVYLRGRQTDFGASEGQKPSAKQTFIEQTQGLGNVTIGVLGSTKEDFTSENLDQLLELEVYGRLNATPGKGKFPVVIYPNGGSPAFQSITCEYLASHGYVVIAFTPKGRFSSGMEVSTIGLEVAVDDFEFVLGKVSEQPNVDMDKVSIVANAISSSVGAAAISRNDKLKALISLEGGLPSAFEQGLLNESVFYLPENITTPILIIYSSHPSIDPKYTFQLKYADRYYAQFPNMSEFAMLNYGMFDTFVPNILGEHKGNTQKGFEEAHQLMLRFLDQKIKDETEEFFDAIFLNSQTEIDSTFVLEGISAPPNIALLKDRFMKDGFDEIESIYKELKENGNLQPYSKSFYKDYRSWLAWQKDEDYTYRQRLYELAYDSYPESARMNYYLAYYSMQVGQNAKAIRHYKNALSFVENDPDLTSSERESIINYTKSDLEELKKV